MPWNAAREDGEHRERLAAVRTYGLRFAVYRSSPLSHLPFIRFVPCILLFPFSTLLVSSGCFWRSCAPDVPFAAWDIWMQTTGVTLLTVKRSSLARVRSPVQDCHRACGLLYLTAVRDGRYEPEDSQGHLDVDVSRHLILSVAGARTSPATYRHLLDHLPEQGHHGYCCKDCGSQLRIVYPYDPDASGDDQEEQGLHGQKFCSWPLGFLARL
jgi:hypothetical protein